MHVAQILRTKGKAVTTVAPELRIAEVVETMTRRRIGAVLVTSGENEVAGILSERDVIQGLANRGAHLLEMRVSEIMTKEVVTCTPDNTVEEIMRVMTNRRVRHIPVLEGGRLCGIISIGDVVKNRLEELSAESDMLRNYIAGA
jgi:CBS domain-containing protein